MQVLCFYVRICPRGRWRTQVTGADGKGFEERPQHGLFVAQGLGAYRALYRLVLGSYDYRCALTGAGFGPPLRELHSDLDVVAIQPREQGGPLAVTNYLPMLGSLVGPFRDGLITIEDDYRLTAPQPALLGAEVLAALRVGLVLPDDPLFLPGAAFLAHHRRYALGR